ncbi:hypothetical protein ENBRE01_0469 [Enteropsectra breve]|nr:hypothetical protein ENBRE01_0469 [Enteropsectra breve]
MGEFSNAAAPHSEWMNQTIIQSTDKGPICCEMSIINSNEQILYSRCFPNIITFQCMADENACIEHEYPMHLILESCGITGHAISIKAARVPENTVLLKCFASFINHFITEYKIEILESESYVTAVNSMGLTVYKMAK